MPVKIHKSTTDKHIAIAEGIEDMENEHTKEVSHEVVMDEYSSAIWFLYKKYRRCPYRH